MKFLTLENANAILSINSASSASDHNDMTPEERELLGYSPDLPHDLPDLPEVFILSPTPEGDLVPQGNSSTRSPNKPKRSTTVSAIDNTSPKEAAVRRLSNNLLLVPAVEPSKFAMESSMNPFSSNAFLMVEDSSSSSTDYSLIVKKREVLALSHQPSPLHTPQRHISAEEDVFRRKTDITRPIKPARSALPRRESGPQLKEMDETLTGKKPLNKAVLRARGIQILSPRNSLDERHAHSLDEISLSDIAPCNFRDRPLSLKLPPSFNDPTHAEKLEDKRNKFQRKFSLDSAAFKAKKGAVKRADSETITITEHGPKIVSKRRSRLR